MTKMTDYAIGQDGRLATVGSQPAGDHFDAPPGKMVVVRSRRSVTPLGVTVPVEGGHAHEGSDLLAVQRT